MKRLKVLLLVASALAIPAYPSKAEEAPTKIAGLGEKCGGFAPPRYTCAKGLTCKLDLTATPGKPGVCVKAPSASPKGKGKGKGKDKDKDKDKAMDVGRPP